MHTTVACAMYCRCWKGKMLHDGWIGSNRPKFTGRRECVTSTDGVAMAMRWAEELDTEGRERGNCCWCGCRLLLCLSKFSSLEREYVYASILSFTMSIIACGMVWGLCCISFEYLLNWSCRWQILELYVTAANLVLDHFGICHKFGTPRPKWTYG